MTDLTADGITIALSIIVGLVMIAIALYSGQSRLAGSLTVTLDKITDALERIEAKLGDLGRDLSDIGNNVNTIQGRTEDIWNKVRMIRTEVQAGGSVYLNLENLGRTRVAANPGDATTDYFIETEQPELSVEMIQKIRAEGDLKQTEVALLGAEVTLDLIDRSRMILKLPSADPNACTQFLSTFMIWLDSTYFERRMEIKQEFEQPILENVR